MKGMNNRQKRIVAPRGDIEKGLMTILRIGKKKVKGKFVFQKPPHTTPHSQKTR